MPRRIQTGYTAAPRLVLAAMGDSLTHNTSLSVAPEQFWPERLAVALREAGVPIRARNFGRSGNTSQQMRDRFALVTRYGVPDVAGIWAGANDPGSSIAGATTQANIEAMASALLDAGTRYVLIGNTQYLNYTSGGDTTTTQSSTYATLKTFQQAAATALIAAYPGRVAYCDTYAYMRNLIVTGVDTQGSASWHVAGTNQHLNAYGEQIVADAMLATIEAQSGWLDALRAG